MDVVDPRKVGEELVKEAVVAAVNAAKENAPGATIADVLDQITAASIYKVWMPKLFNKNGRWGQVVPLVRAMKEEMLAVEPVEQAAPISRDAEGLPVPSFGL